MIKIENTENFAGVTISGDFDDFQNLVDAFDAITISEDDEKNVRYFDKSTRVLGLCYDIRHAFMGDREISLVDNGMDRETMAFQSQITPEKNVYYQCNYLYPEMFFVTIAINELLEMYIKKNSKPKNDYSGALNKAVIWDKNITIVRLLQSAFNECVKNTMSQASYTRWLNIMNDRYMDILLISGHFLDHHNIEFLNMGKDQRFKKLAITAKRIVEYQQDDLHRSYKMSAEEAVEQYHCAPSDLRIPGLEYPEEIDW